MSKINIAKIMVPKVCTRYLHTTDTVRQGFELMNYHHYTAIPVLDPKDCYVGSITEGDFLRFILSLGTTDPKALEETLVQDLVRPDFCLPVNITASDEMVIGQILNQNFIPVVDDRNIFCGIITRKGVIQELAD